MFGWADTLSRWHAAQFPFEVASRQRTYVAARRAVVDTVEFKASDDQLANAEFGLRNFTHGKQLQVRAEGFPGAGAQVCERS